MLTILALMSLNCFSQIDTVKNKVKQTTIISDTTKVVLSKEVAKEVVIDLIKLDGCEEEVKLYQEKIELLNNREEIKDSIIQLLTIKDTNNQSIIILKDEQLKVSKELTENLKIEIKRRKTEGIFYKIGSAIGIITTSILIGIWL
jgi:hypothetical protein